MSGLVFCDFTLPSDTWCRTGTAGVACVIQQRASKTSKDVRHECWVDVWLKPVLAYGWMAPVYDVRIPLGPFPINVKRHHE